MRRPALAVLISTLFYLVLAMCVSACPKTPVSPPPDADADVVVTVTDADAPPIANADAGDVCTRACGVLARLDCPEGYPDAGLGCVAVCRHTQNGAFNIRPDCIAAAVSATQVRACGTVKCAGVP